MNNKFVKPYIKPKKKQTFAYDGDWYLYAVDAGINVIQDDDIIIVEGLDIRDVSSPMAFINATNGYAFRETVELGFQCVAGFKEFMYSWSSANFPPGRIVPAYGGGAKGYATAQGIADVQALGFTWHIGTSGMQLGDWAVFTNGTYGHVAMFVGDGEYWGQNQGSEDYDIGQGFTLNQLAMTPVGYFRPNGW